MTVTRLLVVPVKGLAAVPRQSVRLDHEGVAEDRRVFLLRADGTVVTLRQRPDLARVVPDLDLARGLLTVTLPDGTVAATEVADAVGPMVTAVLFGKRRSGRVLPGAVADVLSHHTGEELRVVFAPHGGVGVDEGPVSLLGTSSAEAIRTPPATGDSTTARFRMLVEFGGAEPFHEDGWVGGRVRLGGALLQVTHPLDRCVVIDRHPGTAQQDWAGLKALAARRGRGRMTLGVIADVVEPGVVCIDDAITELGGSG